jgi:hypothetical protein
MRARLLPLALLLPLAVALGASCGGESLPAGDFPLDAAALDLPSCSDASAAIEINAVSCAAAGCKGVAYAICTGTTYGACSCTGKASGTDAGMNDEPIPTGSEGGMPDVIGAETGPSDTGPSETGPTDTGAKDTGPKDSSPKDTGPKDTAPPDTAPPDTGPADTGPADTGPADTGVPG